MSSVDSFGTRSSLSYGGWHTHYFSLPALEAKGFPGLARLPFSLKILLENLLRHEDGRFVKAADIEALGLKTAQGLVLTEIYYWDLNDRIRELGERFFKRTGRMPNMVQAGRSQGITGVFKSCCWRAESDWLVSRLPVQLASPCHQ